MEAFCKTFRLVPYITRIQRIAMKAIHLTPAVASRPQSLKKENSLMKLSLCPMIAIVCILFVGFIGIVSFTQQVEAHPIRVAYKHTDVNCHGEDSMLGYIICRVFTVTTSTVLEDHPRKNSTFHWHRTYRTDEYDSVDRYYADCGYCQSS